MIKGGNTQVIVKPSQIVPRDRGGGVQTTPLVTRKVGASAFLNGITAFEPGAGIAFHKHNCEEAVVVLEGLAIAEVDGETYELRPFETMWIAAEVPHRFRNASNFETMKILWTYGAVDVTRTNIATGETHSIDMEHHQS